MPPVTLETERLLLRPLEMDDWPAFHEYMSDPDVLRYMSFLPVAEEVSQKVIRDIVQGRAQEPPGTLPWGFGIILRAEGRMIGSCRLGRDGDKPHQADIAYMMNRGYWGRGYMTEAIRALARYGFDGLGLRRLYARCLPENAASRRVMEKIGMRQEEPVIIHCWHKDANRDVTYLSYAIEN